MSLLARYVTHGSWWLTERAIVLALALCTQIILIRLLGTHHYGDFAYLLALVGLLTPLVYAGASGLVSKALLDYPDERESVLRAALAWRLAGGVLAAISGMTIWLTLPGLNTHGTAFLLLCIGQIALAFQLIEYHFQTALTPRGVIPWRLAGAVMGTCLKVGVAWYSRDITAIAAAFALDFLLQAAMLSLAYRRHSGAWLTPLPIPTVHLHRFAVKSPWLLVSGLLEVLYLKIDIVMLEYFRSAHETGVYAAAARLSEVWYLIPTVLMAAWFPLVFASNNSVEAQQQRLQTTMDSLVLAALGLALGIQFMGGWLVTTAFGPAFSEAAPILSWHIWASVFVFLRAVLSKWLIVEDLLSISLLSHMTGAILNIIGNLILIPELGGQGAAISTIVAYASSAWLALFVHPKTRPLARMMTRSLMIPLRLPSLTALLKSIYHRSVTPKISS